MSERIPSLPIYQPNRQLSSLKKHTDLSDVISSKPTDYLHFYFTLKSQQTVLLGILKSIDEHATLFEGKALCKNNSIKNISIKNLDINDVKNSHQNNGNSDNINNTNDLNSTHSPKKHPTTISLPSMKKENEFSINQIKDYLNSFINCSYGELYIISAATINLLQPIIRNPNYSPQVQKFALHFLNSVLAITRMLQSIQNEYQKPPQSQHNSLLLHDINLNDSNDAINNINMDGLSDNSDNNNNLYSDNSCQNSDKNNQKYNDVIVCRICDENVPLELFEEHTKSCIEAYKTEEKIQNIQKEMNAAQNIICENFLREGWPGEQNKALESILPMLRVSLLLERAHQIDPKNTDSIDELEYIVTALTHLNMKLISEKSSSEIVSKVKDIVQQKLKTTTIIRHTSEVLQNTRVSGNAGTEKIAQIQISDFDFIKRISAGAFARVFLAKKKVSNDIYAIKVLPKDDVVQKNQVKRVVLEKDILLSFNNPYIINFCMFQ
ncbi:hypothetical protein TRFO_03521 [Tritrichomonas foetus]|uniref:non-specific serine/threonine protein kinase n=1 Tax=Tritrichomonas foetus TaxID=1144522 RepID=A0A1J4KPC2_9EUKA|nr:hypothetical protein TRFO_03521 [Tritrichomonas foetus]|eukprot:OHT13083.1 hypothetical protein TRFO_03521 [Tritrichomonas foetus]